MADPNIFANNFMAGYSFVDQIKSRNREEKRLEERLSQEREERAFQRRRTNEADQQVRENRKLALEDRARQKKEREAEERAGELIAKGNAKDEDLIAIAPLSPSARKEMERRWGTRRVAEAMNEVQDLYDSGTQSQSNQTLEQAAGQVAPDQTLPDTMSPQQQQQSNQQMNQAAQQQGFAGVRAPGSFGVSNAVADNVKTVPEESVTQFDETFQAKGPLGRMSDVVAGNVQQVTRAAGNVAEGLTQRIATVPQDIPRAAGAAVGGDTFVPIGFVESSDPQYMDASPRERAQIEAKNNEYIQQQKRLALNPSRSVLARPITDQGARQEGGELMRDKFLREESRIRKTYSDFIGTEGGGQLEEIAREDPGAAAIQYLQDRATLISNDPQMTEAVDRRMVPIFHEYRAEVQNRLANMEPDSPQARLEQTRLRNLNISTNTIAKQQPGPNQTAGVVNGLPVGNAELAERVQGAIFDPQKPTVTHHTPQAVQSAATVAGRITPQRRRLNDKQVQSLAVLAEAGYLSKDAVFSVIMTGGFPPGRDPNAWKDIKHVNGVTYAELNGGGFIVIDPGNKNKPTPVPSQEITSDQLGWVAEGFKMLYPEADENQANTAGAFATQNAAWMRAHYTTTSQEEMRQFGVMWAQAVQQSAAQRLAYENDLWPWTNEDDVPKPEEVLFGNDEMRATLAANTGFTMINVPHDIDTTGIDQEAMRRAVEAGDYGVALMQYARIADFEQLAQIIARDAVMKQELDASRQQEQ